MPPKRKTAVRADPLAFIDSYPFVRDIVINKIFGSALGDTIGLYTEFISKASVTSVYAFKSYQWPKFQLVEPATKLYADSHRCRYFSHSFRRDTVLAMIIM